MEVTNARHNAESMFFNDVCEEDFFFSFLKPDMTVFEWGSGYSTLAIAKRVKQVISVEHNLKWYHKMIGQMPDNACLVYVAPNEEEGPGEDGTLEQYKDYVEMFRLVEEKADVCFVDGRARVACCREAINLIKPDGIIFLHDHHNPQPQFDRVEYHIVDTFLEEIGHSYALYAYRPKK